MLEKKVPKLRFSGFSGEWEEKGLGDIVEISKSKYNPVNRKKSYKCIELENLSQETGRILGYFNSDEQKSIKNKFNEGEVLFGKLRPYLKKYWKAEFDGVCSSEIWVLKGKGISNDFLFRIVQTDKFNFISNISSGSKMPRADWSYMSEFSFSIPSLEEQQKIANFFSLIDQKMEKQRKKVKSLEQYKKGMMQKIFSQEIRFKDENGGEYPEWKKTKIGQLFAERSSKGFASKELLSVTINNGVIKRNEIEGKDNSSENKENYKLVSISDIVYNSMRMWQGASGVSNYEGIVSPAYTVLVPQKSVNSHYFGYLFKTTKMIYQFRVNSQGLTSDTWNLKYPLIKDIAIKVPSFEEQGKIVALLSQFDFKIKNEQKKLELLNQWKKSLLQQMFI